MDMYTLILTTAIFATGEGIGGMPGAAISTTSVAGFATLDDCNQAGTNARVPSDRKYYEVDKTWLCVKTKVPR